MTDILNASQTSLYYETKKGLDNFSLNIQEGQILGLLGPNGAGKSTFINCAIGLLEIQKGVLNIFGTPAFQMTSAQKSRIGYDAADINFPNNYTVRDVLDFVKSTYIKWDSKREAYLLNLFSLHPAQLTTIESLSLGGRRKLGFITALCHKPDLIFLDESFSNFDIASKLEAFDFLGDLCSQGVSIIFSSHIADDLERMSSHACIMNKGTDLIYGPLDELKESSFKIISETRPPENMLPRQISNNSYFVRDTSTSDILAWKESKQINLEYYNMNLENIYMSLVSSYGVKAK